MTTAKIMFQSSSGQKAGCNPANSIGTKLDSQCFNPHPARRPDATPWESRTCANATCWFQSSSGQGRMQLSESARQHEGRMQLSESARQHGRLYASFNPHPARRPDATSVEHSGKHHSHLCFNPHPARRPDATASIRPQPKGTSSRVSILIRPEGRMQPRPPTRWTCGSTRCFNPHPARRPDATTMRLRATGLCTGRFQSSSGQKAGCNTIRARMHRPARPCFNPHPARRPDATRGSPGHRSGP